jgi:hypothetical protein
MHARLRSHAPHIRDVQIVSLQYTSVFPNFSLFQCTLRLVAYNFTSDVLYFLSGFVRLTAPNCEISYSASDQQNS